MDKKTFIETIKTDGELVNKAISALYFEEDDPLLKGLTDAEEYSLTAGGKRIRPIIALAFCRMFGGRDEDVLPYSVALEMIHTASLIHDDLPCIDNDDLRRGRPTNHIVFGESTALLAGDGLIIDAFGVIASNENLSPDINACAVKALSDATGTFGMVGGEFIDILGESEKFGLDDILKMNIYKTGALIRAAAILGSLAAGVKMDDCRMKDAITYAESIGLAFQIIDDILDVVGDADTLGKNPGQDVKENKTTYLSFYSLEEASEHADKLTEKALSAVEKYENCEFLKELAKYLLNRNN